MAKRTYKIASQDAVDRYNHELGDTAELDLTDDEHLAVTCAGWLEPVTTAKPVKEKE